MYNVNDAMKKFFRKKVVLPKEKQDSLKDKKDKNLKRLKDGLKEYNDENNTDYKIADTIIQGSVAMKTVIQSDENDYDIDIGIAFNKDNLPKPTTSENNTTTVKNIVYEALLKKSSCFKTAPEKKTNCIRVIYNEGYHIDFAIYRRYKDDDNKYIYEHCGSDWVYRNPRTITKWFRTQDKAHNYKLKKIVTLIKTYIKQNSSWNVPGGLIQSVLVDECIKESDRLDEMLYNTIQAIIDRLDDSIEVYNPMDVDKNGEKISLLRTQNHIDSVTNMKTYLEKGIKKLEILFDDNSCNKEKALRAWGDFFNSEYWNDLADSVNNSAIIECSLNEQIYDFRDTEEFIEDTFSISENVSYFQINCIVKQSGYRDDTLFEYLKSHLILKPKKKLFFSIPRNIVLGKYDIYWKILNRGIEAERLDKVRGQIIKGDFEHTEHTQFRGDHIVYCYIVQNNECVAIGKVEIPITT